MGTREEGFAHGRTLRSILLASATGVLIGLAGAPFELSFPAFLAPAALLAALEPLPGEPVRVRSALALGLLAGFVTNVMTMYWVVGLLMDFGHFPLVAAVPVGVVLWVGQAIGWVVTAVLSVAVMRRGAPGWLVVPACATVAHTLAPALFPWRYGLSQLPWLEYAQVAELGGMPLLDWLVATAGCAVLDAVRKRRLAPAVVAALALALPYGYGALRLPEVRAERDAAPSLAVGVVQPNVSIVDKHDPRLFYPQLEELRAATVALEARGAELVIWPETAYRYPIRRRARRDRRGALAALGDGVRGPLIVGAITVDGVDRYNSAVAFEPDGRVASIADKVNLLAFGEYVPLRDQIPGLERFGRGLTPGEGPQIVSIAGARVGVLNCYEDLLADYVRSQARHEPSFFANVTNNAWFGDTTAPHLHHMNGRIRAIETRRDVVRVVNTGVSGHTAATGRDLARTETFVPAAFVADVRLLDGVTPWVRFGDLTTPALAGALLGLILARRRRRPRLTASRRRCR